MRTIPGRTDLPADAGWDGSKLPGCADAVVVGAGPVGCVAALALAERGAEVLLLEAQPSAARRLAGEWLHPPAAQLLTRLNAHASLVGTGVPAVGRGFVVHSGPGEDAIRLDYARGARGLSCEHSVLVGALRETATAHSGVRFVPFARVTRVDGQRVTVEDERSGAEKEVLAARVVVASGRSGRPLEWAGGEHAAVTVSYTAGVVLEGAELPIEEYGYLILGGPGPVLVYRLDDLRVRVCLDVPIGRAGSHGAAAYLWKCYGQVLPRQLHPAFRRALQAQSIVWAANRVRPRRTYGRDGLMFAGDAVGHFHPLTAAGISVGIDDAECVARSESFVAYRQERSSRTRVAELLASALYAVFSCHDEASLALRQAIYDTWRHNPEQRARTMGFLSTEDASTVRFGSTFLEIMGMALRRTASHAVSTRRWGPTSEALQGYAAWLQWLGRATVRSPALPPPVSAATVPAEPLAYL